VNGPSGNGRPQSAVPPGRHAGQGSAPDRPAGSYQGSRRSTQPNGAHQDRSGGRDATPPGGGPARPQDRPDPLTDPSYGRRPGSRPARSPQPRHGSPRPEAARYGGPPPAGYGDGTGGYPPGQFGGEGPGRGGDAHPGKEPTPRDGRYPRDEPGPSGDRYPRDEPSPSGDRRAGPGAYRGRRRSNGPGGPGGPPWSDASDDGYEDDRFVPGLGGPRYRDEDAGDGYPDDAYEDDGYDDGEDGGDGPGRPRRGRPSGRGARHRRSRWIAPLVAVIVILTPVVIGGVYAFNLYQSKYHPADYATAGTGQAIVEVQSGQTATAVGDRLVTLGVVASVRAFELAAEHSTNSRGLEPGFYRMHKHMKASLAFALLLNPAARIQDKITIPEGWRLSQIETALGARSGIPLADYQQALASPGSLGLPSYANGNPEGYLYPATYVVEPNMSAATVLQAMSNRFNQEAVSISLTAAAAQAHMTPAQVITVASLLQAEGGSISDYRKIARVILNRLAANMPLQFDSTVLYGLDQFGTTVTDKQIASNTPYNTYQHKGLPPRPIDSPGNSAIEAALHPASGNWLYFVASKNGVTRFSATLSGLTG